MKLIYCELDSSAYFIGTLLMLKDNTDDNQLYEALVKINDSSNELWKNFDISEYEESSEFKTTYPLLHKQYPNINPDVLDDLVDSLNYNIEDLDITKYIRIVFIESK